MKRFILLAALTALFFLPATSAQAVEYGGIEVNNWTIQSVTPTSFTSADIAVRLNVNNTRSRIAASDISGVIYAGGNMFIIGTADDVVIPHGTADIVIRCHGSLRSFSALLSLMNNLSINPADYSFDARATVKVGWSRAHVVEMKQVPLSTFLK